MKITDFNDKYPNFIYKSYKIDIAENKIDIEYEFIIENLATFNPKWSFPRIKDFELDLNILNKLAFNLGLAECASYWKAKLSKNFIIEAGYLSEEQVNWWKNLYYHGLGEFFYINEIEVNKDNIMTMQINKNNIFIEEPRKNPLNDNLIAIGGGKDSIVSIDLLSNYKNSNYFFYINTPSYSADSKKIISNTIKFAGYNTNRLITATRIIDQKILESVQRGYLTGHTPLSAVIAFSSVTAAYINGIKNVILSNESSSNDYYVIGTDINHQYSKSFELEKDFIKYNDSYIQSEVSYFSLLRPFNEYQITKYFANLSYLNVFKSCNLGKKKQSWNWCLNCSKCLFTYLILSPFIAEEKLIEAFGENLLDKKSLLEDFKQLYGELPNKPFECVGTRHEVNIALCEIIKKHKANLPYLLQIYKKSNFYEKYKDMRNDLNDYFDNQNLIPKEFLTNIERLYEYVKEKNN